MRVLITGGSGFVGRYLAEHLIKDYSWSVSITKVNSKECLIDDVEVYYLDILDKTSVISILKQIKPEYIFHLAAQSSVKRSWQNPEMTVDVNIKGTINLLESIRELDYSSRVLLIGSGEEYGHVKSHEIPIHEECLVRPGNIYAITKIAQNLLGKTYSDAYGLDIIMVRAFNHMGPRQTPTFVVADFCKQVAEIEKGLKDPIISVGNLSAKRDFLDVRDVVKAYALLIQNGIKGEIYNVGSGSAVAIEDILKMILSFSKVDIKVIQNQNKLRPLDAPLITADISKLIAVTKWQRNLTLEQSLIDTLNYWREII